MGRTNTHGFSLVELLSVILLLAVLTAVAVPLYLSARRSAAARTCKANLTALCAAESAFMMRHSQYNATPMLPYDAANPTSGGLIGAPEGLVSALTCPWDGVAYVFSGGGVPGEALTLYCPHCATAKGGDGRHEQASPSPDGFSGYYRTLAAPASGN